MTSPCAVWLLASAMLAQAPQALDLPEAEAHASWLGEAMADGVLSDGLSEELGDGLGGPFDGFGEGFVPSDDIAALEAWRADPLDLNQATLEELAELPGMTPSLAAVVRHARPLQSLSEFLRLGELPAGLAESLLPFVRVGAPQGAEGADLAAFHALLAAPPGAHGSVWASRWRASAGAAWHGAGAPAPLLELAGSQEPGDRGAQDGLGWEVHAQASLLPQATGPAVPAHSLEPRSGGQNPASGGLKPRSGRRSAVSGGWEPGWDLGRVRLQPQAAHVRGQWGHVAAGVGDFTAGYAEGLTLERSPRRTAAGWTLRPPPRFCLPRGRWITPPGWQGAVVSWSAPQLTLTALGGIAPQAWGGGAIRIGWLEGLQTTLVGYGTAAPPHVGPAPVGRASASPADTPPDGVGRVVSRGALGLGLRARHGAWELAGEGSHGLPAGWGWHLGGAWQVAAPLQLGLRWRGATEDFGHAYQRGGLRAPWPVRSGTQAQAQLRLGAWRGSTRLVLDLPRWRLDKGVAWAPTAWEQLRLGASLRPQASQRDGRRPRGAKARQKAQVAHLPEGDGPTPLQWSAHAQASSRRLLRLPVSLDLRASPRALRTTARLRWLLFDDTALGLALTAAVNLPQSQRMEAALGLDVRHRWERWDVVARTWTGRGARWEHAALLVVAAHY